jgi:hypothetical protein
MAARVVVRRKKPLLRLLDAAAAHASGLSWVLLALGTLGMLAVPLAGRKIFFDENSLLVGSARAYIRCWIALPAAKPQHRGAHCKLPTPETQLCGAKACMVLAAHMPQGDVLKASIEA